MPTAAQLLDFETQFDACLQATFQPLVGPLGIPFVVYQDQNLPQALVPRLQGRYQNGSVITMDGNIQAVGNRAQPQAWNGHVVLDLLTRRNGEQDPRPIIGQIRDWMRPKYQYLNDNLAWLQISGLGEMDSKRTTFDEGGEKCDINTLVYQIVFNVKPAYFAVLS